MTARRFPTGLACFVAGALVPAAFARSRRSTCTPEPVDARNERSTDIRS